MHFGREKLIVTIIIAILLLSVPAYSVDIGLNGFLQGNYSVDTSSSNPDGGDLKWAEERAQFKLDVGSDPFRLFSKTDFYYDHIDDDADLEFRELYLDYTSAYFDVRAGRQIITWGLGDMVFINDIFPKDYEAFFSGRPLEYLKKGIDGIKMGLYPDFLSIDIVVIPFFEPNNFPGSGRFWMFDPMPDIARSEEKPSVTLENTEVAVRLYRDVAGFDAALYFYRGFFRNPSMIPDNPLAPSKLTLFYPKLSVYGASLQGRAFDGVMSLEAGYYDSRQDRDGTDPVIPNSGARFLTGYQRQLWEDFTVGVQYYGEYMADYANYEKNLPDGFPGQKRYSDLFTVRLTQLLMHQTLRLSYFSFWSLSDGDYLINPEIKYSFTDSIWTAVGASLFGGGEKWSQFGQFDKNDNVYVQVRYEF
ncbi:hypothetical protein BMS3Abin07_02616 [bacterium BMS3Abin07]|nr:hypothetical protein BMS3Abin07_02616 [bacterium BMS3Abin07]GBE31712.1 hypothetical protein BMS3Bbin05_00615 [bacterium BMS3Bbin05]HDO21396.1 hypothetical protein [Nitrospirota bacterium]HDZ88246.1 hypothetical protein [Nitrospirota bacterium]